MVPQGWHSSDSHGMNGTNRIDSTGGLQQASTPRNSSYMQATTTHASLSELPKNPQKSPYSLARMAP